MSSLFSDPPFARGATLLNGEAIELDFNGNPIAGVEIVGQVKAFQDVVPGTGPAAIRNSNRLVYCIAARYVGTSIINVQGADRGRVYVMNDMGPLATFSASANTADTTNGKMIGVLDEYLSIDVRPNDIVWLVVKGPVTANKDNALIAAHGKVQITSLGRIQAHTSTNPIVGVTIRPGVTTTGTSAGIGSTFTVGSAAGITVGMTVSGTGIAANTTVTGISGTTVTVSPNTTGAVSGDVIFGAGYNANETTVRINLECDQI
jgi:hypothetical protein